MRKVFLLIFGVVAFVFNANGQNSSSQLFQATHKYLKIPIKNGAPKRQVELWLKNDRLRWFDAELADSSYDWIAYLDIEQWKGQELKLIAKDSHKNIGVLNPIIQSNSDSTADMYSEAGRGQFHFSAKRGWLNDPNGLVFFNGQYHLFFQHNPYGTNWGNMHWGHAVSADLVHWKELGEALYPEESGVMFSGGAVIDSANSSGLDPRGSEKPMILFYTAAEKSWKQGLAYSLDGRKFEKLPSHILDKITTGNRDPKVIWHEASKHWVLVLYVEEQNEQHTMQIFTSKDMKVWAFASKIEGGKGNDRYLFECPELFELAVDGNPKNKKWVLTGANSQYAIGEFDGKSFRPELERQFSQYGRDYYAAQTFSNEPSGRRVEIGWWRTHTNQNASAFNQSMSIPMELTLKRTEKGIRLFREPVTELKKLRKEKRSIGKTKIIASMPDLFQDFRAELAEMNLVIEPRNAKNIQINVRGLAIHYNVLTEELVVDNVRAHVPLRHQKLSLKLFVDRTGLELFAQHGEIYMPINYNFDRNNFGYTIKSGNGEAILETAELYTLQSIWPR